MGIEPRGSGGKDETSLPPAWNNLRCAASETVLRLACRSILLISGMMDPKVRKSRRIIVRRLEEPCHAFFDFSTVRDAFAGRPEKIGVVNPLVGQAH